MKRKLAVWIILFAVVAVLDSAVRFALPFNLRQVLIVEVVLFFTAGVAAAFLATRSPRFVGWRYKIQWALAAALILAAVRSCLWAIGLSVYRANMVILALAILATAAAWIRGRRLRSQPLPPAGNAAA